MADDLHDDWWAKDEITDDKEGELNESEDSAVDVNSNKSEDEEKEDVSQVKNNNALKRKLSPTAANENDDEQVKKKKKKRKKMTITEVLAKNGPCIPEASQLIEIINNTFKDTLPIIEYEEIVINEKHFCECNTKELKIIEYLKSIENAWPYVPPQPTKDKFVKSEKGKNKKNISDKSSEKKSEETVKGEDNLIKGSPLILVITCGAIRATDLIRELKKDNTSGVKIAKLFSKHLKLKEITKFLKNTEIHIGVGNPNRIKLLLENGSLSLSRCTHIVLDWSWRDIKQYRFIDQQSNKTELMNLLHKSLLTKVKSNNMKFALY